MSLTKNTFQVYVKRKSMSLKLRHFIAYIEVCKDQRLHDLPLSCYIMTSMLPHGFRILNIITSLTGLSQ